MWNKIVLLTFLLSLSCATAFGNKWRNKRQVTIHQREQIPANPDRSVYARRNFGQTGVVSDVYEVYVGPSNQPGSSRSAIVVLQGDKGVSGIISFLQESPTSPVFLNGTIQGLTPGNHGFHIHQKGDLSGGCGSTGGHYNPYMQPHGSPQDRNRHIGDLGNIEADVNGVSNVRIADPLIALSGVNSIIGRAVVVHEGEDDLGRGGSPGSKKTGNAGGRLACGVIGLL